jgi:hypothetical protein
MKMKICILSSFEDSRALLKNEKLLAALGKAARSLVTSTYDWSQITKKLEIAMNGLIS